MKQLNVPHPLLLITIGYPGAGKSTLAKQLAEQLSFGWIHGNRLRYELFSEPSFAKQEEDVVNNLADYLLDEMLRTKGHIVYDGSANSRTTRQRLASRARQAGYKVVTVWVQTDVDTARFRATKRSKQADQYAISTPSNVFERFAGQLTKPLPNELCVVISGKHTPAAQVKALVSKLESVFNESPEQHTKVTVRKQQSPKTKPANKKLQNAKPSLDEKGGRPSPHPEQRSKPRFDIMRRIKVRQSE